MTTIIPTAQKVSWRTVALNGSVWALRRGHWYAAVVTGRRGRKTCRVTFLDTGKGVQRSYEELAGRATFEARRGSAG